MLELMLIRMDTLQRTEVVLCRNNLRLFELLFVVKKVFTVLTTK